MKLYASLAQAGAVAAANIYDPKDPRSEASYWLPGMEAALGAIVRTFRELDVPGGTSTKPAEAPPIPVRINEPTQTVTDLGGDPLAIAKAKGFTGDMCSSCGGMDMVRTGTCTTCTSCGSTSGGCS